MKQKVYFQFRDGFNELWISNKARSLPKIPPGPPQSFDLGCAPLGFLEKQGVHSPQAFITGEGIVAGYGYRERGPESDFIIHIVHDENGAPLPPGG